MSTELMSMISDEQIIKSRRLLQNPYAHMDELGFLGVLVSKSQTKNGASEINKLMGNPYASLDATQPYSNSHQTTKITNSELIPNLRAMQDPYAFIRGNTVKISKYVLMGNPYARINEVNNTNDNLPISRFEQLARDIQIKLWKRRNQLWPHGVPTDPVDLLEPSVALCSIGYDYSVYETLDNYSNGVKFKIAGLIDQSNKKVFISNQFSQEIQRFTSAHELGHALMHQGSGLHRDRALDGSRVKGKKEEIEIEADKFAAFFLMPRNLVLKRFKQIFGTHSFILDDATIFALDPGNQLNLMAKKNNIRYISRVLAETEHYSNQHFISLSRQFRVSVEAMAIRIEELKLVNI